MAEEENVLYVRMLGRFMITWNGAVYADGERTGQTQVSQLLQLLLHRRHTGVRRSEVIETLFHDREIQNASHSLCVVLYKAGRRLAELGLPGAACIVRGGGLLRWNDDVPVREDAEDFEEAVTRASWVADREERLRGYLTACAMYTGEFLPLQAGSLWVSEEAFRYRKMYGDCVRCAAEFLREQGDHLRLEVLGRSAARVQPYEEWERLAIEAMLSRGRTDTAQAYYREAADRYRRELGVEFVVPEMEAALCPARQERQVVPAQTIEQRLREGDSADGGYICPYPVFEGLYHMAQRSAPERDAYLMICTAEDRADEAALQQFQNVIAASVRWRDAVARYGERQFLILISDGGREACEAARRRIAADAAAVMGGAALQFQITHAQERSER